MKFENIFSDSTAAYMSHKLIFSGLIDKVVPPGPGETEIKFAFLSWEKIFRIITAFTPVLSETKSLFTLLEQIGLKSSS